MQAHVEEGSEGAEEMRRELRAVIRGHMEGDSMLGKDVGDKSICNINSGGRVCGRDENTFLGEVINDDQDHCITIGQGQLLDEVHAY